MTSAPFLNIPENKKPWVQGAVIVLLTIIAYWTALHCGFIWDDDSLLVENKHLDTLQGLKNFWFSTETSQYYPLFFTSLWIEKHLWGLNPAGYHAVNVLLHAANAVLAWRVFRSLGLKSAWWIGLVFALHPVHVESVAWICERKNVLSGFFFLSSLLAFLRFEKNGNRWQFYASLVLYVLALLTKTVTCTLPAVFLILRWMRGEKITVRFLLNLLPFLLIGLAMGILTITFEKHIAGADGSEWNLTWIDRPILAGRILCFYISKLLWPGTLTFIYPRWELNWMSLRQWVPLAGFLSVLGLAWLSRNRIGRGPAAALVLFAVTLFPALGFFNVYPMRYSFVADHFQYLASLAILAPAVEFLWNFSSRFDRARSAAGLVLLFILAFRTSAQCSVYQNYETLWIDTIRKNPSAGMAYNNLAVFYAQKKEYAKSVILYQKVLKMVPANPTYRHYLAVDLANDGDLVYAKKEFLLAIKLYRMNDPENPRRRQAYRGLANAYGRLGETEKALALFHEMLEENPDFIFARFDLALLFHQMKRYGDALKTYRQILEQDPNYPGIHYNMAVTFLDSGDTKNAVKEIQNELVLDPNNPWLMKKLVWVQKQEKNKSK